MGVEAWIHARAGRTAESRHALRNLERLIRDSPVHPQIVVMAYAGVDRDRAIAALEQLAAERSHLMTTLKVDPSLDPLRDDPRFKDLLRRVGLAS